MTTKKDKTVDKEEKKKTAKTEKYFYAVGRRKTAVAKVKLFPKKGNQSSVAVNGEKLEEYFSLGRLQDTVKSPLLLSGEKKFEAEAKVSGGGTNAQAEAIRLGIARALVVFDEDLKKSLKDAGYLTRDSREVERKKAGLKKARRAPQFSKR